MASSDFRDPARCKGRARPSPGANRVQRLWELIDGNRPGGTRVFRGRCRIRHALGANGAYHCEAKQQDGRGLTQCVYRLLQQPPAPAFASTECCRRRSGCRRTECGACLRLALVPRGTEIARRAAAQADLDTVLNGSFRSETGRVHCAHSVTRCAAMLVLPSMGRSMAGESLEQAADIPVPADPSQ